MKVALFLFCAVLGAALVDAPPRRPSVEEVRLDVLSRTVSVAVEERWYGSGLRIQGDLVLTAGHLVQDVDDLGMKLDKTVSEKILVDGVEATIVAYDFENDLALLRAPGAAGRSIEWGEPRVFEKAYVVACPGGHPPVCEAGEILQLVDRTWNFNQTLHSAPTIGGSSGGLAFVVRAGRPVFVGVVSRSHPRLCHLGWVVSWKVAKEFVEACR